MAKPVILVIDQGTSSTKAFLFDRDLHQIHREKIRHHTQRPRPGWAEIDARQIVTACRSLANSLMSVCKKESLAPLGAGIAFQRSTFLFWNRNSGDPLTPAMSWQDTRAQEITARFHEHNRWTQETTGIPLTPHFGGPKFLFSVRDNPDLRSRVKRGDVLFGPVSAFVTQNLAGHPLLDESIAGRTLLLNLKKMEWDPQLLDLFEVPPQALPDLAATCGEFGSIETDSASIPLLCVIGDQQASLVGRGQLQVGEVAMNFGTSGSVLVYTGKDPIPVPLLLANVLYSSEGERHFLLEGTINSVGSLFKWLEDYLNIPHREMKRYRRCTGPTEGILVPGIAGLSSPYWTGEFEPFLSGFSEPSRHDEIVRAGMESIGFLVNDIWEIIHAELGESLGDIIASGGSSRPVLLQFIADLTKKPLWNSTGRDMTALGVAKLVAGQLWDNATGNGDDMRQNEFMPTMSDEVRLRKIARWHNALEELKITKKDSQSNRR